MLKDTKSTINKAKKRNFKFVFYGYNKKNKTL